MTFTPLLREGKNMGILTTFLDRLEKKTEEICELNEIRKQLEARHRAFQSAIYTAFNSHPKTNESAEDYVRRMAADKFALEGRRRELVAITTAIEEIPLPRPADESYEQYILRLGDYIRAVSSALKELGPCDGETIADSIHRMRRERNNAERKMAELEDSHARTIEQANARIAKLETRESDLNALHDAIESLPGFPMQPEEKYAEYLQRLAADRAHHADERSRLFTDLEHLKASSAQTLERLRSQLDQNNEQYASERAKNQLLIDQLQNTCSSEELAEALRERDQARRELADEKAGMKTQQSLLCDALTMRDKAQEKAQTAIAEREHFRAKWDASLKARDSAQDEARRTRETNEALQGQLTLRSQIIARVMMDPATNKLFNERDWSDAARKVLIDARGMSIDDGKVQA